jgi:hypothetical protein
MVVKKRVMRKRVARKPRVAKALSKGERKEVKRLIKGTAETKRTAWYSSFNDGTSTNRATGKRSDAGTSIQNNIIANNNTDILRLVPNVLQGIDDFCRIGTRITVNSLKLNGMVRVNIARLGGVSLAPTDIRVCIYVLQHKQFKDYQTLYNTNDFQKMLDNEEGGTERFNGIPINETMRVSDQYYQVCKKKIITLRYAGVTSQGGGVNGVLSVANSHNWYASYSMNLTKFLPKVLKYPETSQAPPLAPEFANAPTNSSLFMCMGFVDQYFVSNFAEPSISYIQQSYVTNLGFKDT